jgi:tyrosinase
MRISHLLSAVLVGSTNARKFMENDALAAEGVLKLSLHLAEKGIPGPGTCTPDKLSIRREWSASFV